MSVTLLLIYAIACSVSLTQGRWRHDSLRPLTNAIAMDAPTAKTNTASMPENQVAATYSNQQLPPIQPLPMTNILDHVSLAPQRQGLSGELLILLVRSHGGFHRHGQTCWLAMLYSS